MLCYEQLDVSPDSQLWRHDGCSVAESGFSIMESGCSSMYKWMLYYKQLDAPLLSPDSPLLSPDSQLWGQDAQVWTN